METQPMYLVFITQNFLYQIANIYCLFIIYKYYINVYILICKYTFIHKYSCCCLKYRENGVSRLFFTNLLGTIFIIRRLQPQNGLSLEKDGPETNVYLHPLWIPKKPHNIIYKQCIFRHPEQLLLPKANKISCLKAFKYDINM